MPEPYVIAPVKGQPANYKAFKDDEMILRIFSGEILDGLKDSESVENRKAALSAVCEAIRGCEQPETLVEHLQKLVVLLMIPMGDLNIKIVLKSLQILQDLIDQVEGNIVSHLNQILSTYLEKIACNKYNIKQNGMKLLLHLMRVAGPAKVISVIMEHGTTSRRSKVREETINILIIALLRFPDDLSFNLKNIIEKIAPMLADTKRSVRQSCLEACAVFTKCLGKDGLQLLVSAVASVDKTVQENMTDQTATSPTLMQAFEMRLSRNILPSINSDGLLNHQVNVTNGKGSSSDIMFTGADVDWIMAGAGKSSSPSAGGRKMSMSGSGPLRSAGKKLPWDPQEKPSKVKYVHVHVMIYYLQ